MIFRVRVGETEIEYQAGVDSLLQSSREKHIKEVVAAEKERLAAQAKVAEDKLKAEGWL